MRRAAAVLALAAASSVARADATVPSGGDAPPLRCSYDDAAYFRDVRSDRVKRAQAVAGADFYFQQASAHHVLFADRDAPRRPSRAVLVDLDTNRKLTIDAGAATFLEDAAGHVFAMVALEYGTGMIELLDGAGRRRWSAYDEPHPADLAAAVAGTQLFVATFNHGATGSALRSYDLATGRLLWTAGVEQLNVGHSKYYNDVTVEARGGRVILRGVEAFGCYVQVFDADNGFRISSRIVHPKP